MSLCKDLRRTLDATMKMYIQQEQMVEGYNFIDHHSWDAYNEGADLQLQIDKYKERFGCLPATILADKIYMNKANRAVLKDLEIRNYSKPLGRPPKEPPSPERQALMAKAVGQRNEIECSFGTGKRVPAFRLLRWNRRPCPYSTGQKARTAAWV